MNDTDPSKTNQTDEPMFDTSAAERERLDWKLGGKQPTERALGLQENLDRRISDEIKAKLGKDASKDMEPEE